MLPQNRNDLLFREPRSLHRPVLPSGRTLASPGGNNGGHSSKAAATTDAQDGYSDAELDAKFGWTGRKMAAHYTRTVNRERLSIAAAARVNREHKSRPMADGAGLKGKKPNRNNG